MDVMEAFNFSLAQVVHVSDFVIESIPQGSPLLIGDSIGTAAQ
jgi:hypothetical protein